MKRLMALTMTAMPATQTNKSPLELEADQTKVRPHSELSLLGEYVGNANIELKDMPPGVDAGLRQLEYAILCGVPFERPWGWMVIMLDGVDLSRVIDTKMPFLLGHKESYSESNEKILGRVIGARIDSDGVLRAVVAFSESGIAQAYLSDVDGGVQGNCSVGLQDIEMRDMTEIERDQHGIPNDGIDARVLVQSRLLHVAAVAQPALSQTGVGLAAETPPLAKPQPTRYDAEPRDPPPPKETKIPRTNNMLTALALQNLAAKISQPLAAVVKAAASFGDEATEQGLIQLFSTAGDLSSEAISGYEKQLTELRDTVKKLETAKEEHDAKLLKQIELEAETAAANGTTGPILMPMVNFNKATEYSLISAVTKPDQGLEHDWTEYLSEQTSKGADGSVVEFKRPPNTKPLCRIPQHILSTSLLRHRALQSPSWAIRDSARQRLTELSALRYLTPEQWQKVENHELALTPTNAGSLIGKEHMADLFVEMLRESTPLGNLGVRMVTGLIQDPSIPRQTGATTGHWIDNAGTTGAAQSNIATDAITMSPKTLSVYAVIVRKMLLQALPAAEAMTISDIVRTLGIQQMLALVGGTGSNNQPTGYLNETGIQSVTSAGSGGVMSPSYQNVIDMVAALLNENVPLDESCRWLMTPTVMAKLMGTAQFASSNGQAILMGDMMLGRPANYWTGFPGSSATIKANRMTLACWSEVFVGLWGAGGIEVRQDTDNQPAGGFALRAFMDMDIAFRHLKGIVNAVAPT